MEGHSYAGVYRVTDYAHPFDSYAGEEVLLLDEYSSNFKIRDLLNYLDGYPLRFQRGTVTVWRVTVVSTLYQTCA